MFARGEIIKAILALSASVPSTQLLFGQALRAVWFTSGYGGVQLLRHEERAAVQLHKIPFWAKFKRLSLDQVRSNAPHSGVRVPKEMVFYGLVLLLCPRGGKERLRLPLTPNQTNLIMPIL